MKKRGFTGLWTPVWSLGLSQGGYGVVGGATTWEAQESRLPSVFEQLTWQQVGPTKAAGFPSLLRCRRLQVRCPGIQLALWCRSGPWQFFWLWLSLVRSWWVGSPVLPLAHTPRGGLTLLRLAALEGRAGAELRPSFLPWLPPQPSPRPQPVP